MELVQVATVLGASLAIGIGTIAPALAQGNVASKAVESMARQPESTNDIRGTMILGMAIMESLTIYALVIALVLIFANPFVK
ncbi:MAG: ATP synthase F0 subunit C [bacterium]